MRNALVLSMIVLAAAPAAKSITVCAGSTMDKYIAAGFSCTIDDKLFSAFDYRAVGNPAGISVPANQVDVTPITTAFNPGFDFSGLWDAARGQSLDVTIRFTVSVLTGGNAIKDSSLSIRGNTTQGSYNVTESLCLDGAFTNPLDPDRGCSAPSVDILTASNTAASASHEYTTTFTTIDVIKKASVKGGAQPTGVNTAILANIREQFSEIPEPSTITLVGLGSLALIVLGRRLKAR